MVVFIPVNIFILESNFHFVNFLPWKFPTSTYIASQYKQINLICCSKIFHACYQHY